MCLATLSQTCYQVIIKAGFKQNSGTQKAIINQAFISKWPKAVLSNFLKTQRNPAALWDSFKCLHCILYAELTEERHAIMQSELL